jgi:hypothetical protein
MTKPSSEWPVLKWPALAGFEVAGDTPLKISQPFSTYTCHSELSEESLALRLGDSSHGSE